MKRFALARLVAVLGAALLLVGVSAPGALATATSTNGQISVSGDPWPPVAGQNVLITGTVVFDKASLVCRVWTLTLDGQKVSGDASSTTRNGNTVTFSHTYFIPANTPASQGHDANATCTVHDTIGYSDQNLDPTLTTAGHDLLADHTVNGVTGSLPGAGGPSIWWLLVGCASILSGALAIESGRRRRQAA